ncbi:MAG TPA: tetratricopeptide repeat protein [Rhodocyclaceae bacterium]
MDTINLCFMNAEVFVLTVLFGFGGIGGIVRAIIEDSRTENSVTMPFSKRLLALGWVGDLLVGGAAAIVGYTFFDMLGTGTGDKIPGTVKLAGFGIAAGYAGARILNAMLDKFPERKLDLLAAKQDALRLLQSHKYLLAARRFRDIVAQDPSDVQARASLALALSYTGEDGIREALELLDKVVADDPNNAEAWYNLACIRAIATFRQFSDDEVLTPLKKAIDLDPVWAQNLKTDKDFNRFRTAQPNVPYQKLTGDLATAAIV